jgi:hypothetical protein
LLLCKGFTFAAFSDQALGASKTMKSTCKQTYLGIMIFILSLYLLFAVFEIFNIGSLYKDQIEFACAYPKGYTLQEWEKELRMLYYFFLVSAILDPILIIYLVYRFIKKLS